MTPTETKAITCPECKGAKSIKGVFPIYVGLSIPNMDRNLTLPVICPLCQGTGTVDAGYEERRRRGTMCRANRIYCGLGISDFAMLNNLSKVGVSQFERGILLTDEETDRIKKAYHNLIP